MATNNDLMSFLASASRHIPVNEERLAETHREEVRQQALEEEARRAARMEEEMRRAQEREELIRAATTLEQSTVRDSRTDTTVSTFQDIIDKLSLARGDENTEVQEELEPEIPEEEKPLPIPAYSAVREELVRFSDAEWFKKVQEKVIVLAGIGGIGSNMAVILAKLNPSAIYIFDNDRVDASNLAGQFYSNDDIGKPKVDALAASVNKYTNYSSIFALNRRYQMGEEIISDIMICGFDNMQSRRQFFTIWSAHVLELPEDQRGNCLFIDGRLTADEFQIFCIVGNDTYYMKEYEEKYLFSDYEAVSERCSYKQTGFLADMIGAFMVNLLVNFCANQVNPKKNMNLPFMTSYRSSMMFLDFKR